MKHLYIVPILFIGIFFSCSQKTAEEYYKMSKNEIDSKKKIELLTKAIELKPDYFDAIYYRAYVVVWLP